MTPPHDIFPDPEELFDREELWAYVGYARALCAVITGRDSGEAEMRLELLIDDHRFRLEPASESQSLMCAARVLLAYARGDFDRAGEYLVAEPEGRHPLLDVWRPRILLAQGRIEDALDCTYRLARGAHPEPRLRIGIHLVRAECRVLQEDAARAEEEWNTACAIADEYGCHLPFAFVSSSCRTAIEEAAFAGGPGLRMPIVALEPRRPINVTRREAAVLAELVRGGSQAEIAEALFVSVNTVKTQLRSVYRKLRVNSRRDAIEAVRVDPGLIA